MSGMTNLARRYLDLSADPRPLGIVRAIIGLAALASTGEALYLLPRALDPALLHLPLLPLPRLPQGAAPGFLGIWMVCAALVAIGLAARPAAATLAALLGYYILLDQQLYSNHMYLLLLLLLFLTLARSDAAFSLFARRRAAPGSVPGWPVLLIKLQITSVYVFGAVTKINPAFLSGAVIAGVVALPLPLSPTFLAVLTIVTELFIAYGLWRPRLRPLAALAGLGLHGSILVSMGAASALDAYQLAVFSLMICSPYLLFFRSASGSPARRTP